MAAKYDLCSAVKRPFVFALKRRTANVCVALLSGLLSFMSLCIRLKARRSYISFLESVHRALLWCFFGVAALHVGIRSKARISSSNCAAAALLLISSIFAARSACKLHLAVFIIRKHGRSPRAMERI